MKLAFITTGSIRNLATLKRATGMAPYLLEAGHEVTIVLMDDPVNRDRVARECSEVKAVWFEPGLGAFAERDVKRKLVRELNPDVAYVCGYGVRNAIRSKDTFGKVVTEYCELGSKTMSQPWLRRLMERYLEHLSVVHSDTLVCASRYLEQLYGNRMKSLRDPLPIIYSPYAFGSADVATDDQRKAGDELRIGRGGTPSILYMGAIRENYGAMDMIEAARLLKQRGTEFHLELIGEGLALETVKAFIHAHDLSDCVTCHGYVDDDHLPELLASADAFLAPIYDTPQDLARCPSKVFLYVSYQKPIVTCPFGEPKECLGDAGFYYTPGNVEAMAEAISRALEREADNLVDPELHTWKTRTARFLESLTGIPSDDRE